MGELYFREIEGIGNLYMERTLMKFEDEDIVFICVDDNGQKYLGVCYEMRMILEWVLCRVSDETISQVLSGIITLRACFTMESEVLLIRCTGAGEETAEWKRQENVDPRILPDEDFYVK